MSAEIAHLFMKLPDLSPPPAFDVTGWLGKRAQNEWRAMPAAQAIIKRVAQIEARRRVVAK